MDEYLLFERIEIKSLQIKIGDFQKVGVFHIFETDKSPIWSTSKLVFIS